MNTATIKIPSALMFIGFVGALEVEGESLTWSPEDAPVLTVGDDMRTIYIFGGVEEMEVVDRGDQETIMSIKWQGFTGRGYEGVVGGVEFETPESLMLVGKLDAITYIAPRDMGEGEWTAFRHRFEEGDAPVLHFGDDGNLYIVGGSYRFTQRGIVDDSDKAHADVV